MPRARALQFSEIHSGRKTEAPDLDIECYGDYTLVPGYWFDPATVEVRTITQTLSGGRRQRDWTGEAKKWHLYCFGFGAAQKGDTMNFFLPFPNAFKEGGVLPKLVPKDDWTVCVNQVLYDWLVGNEYFPGPPRTPAPTAQPTPWPTGSGTCPQTCEGETCDYWADDGFACADELEKNWGCDCSGCE